MHANNALYKKIQIGTLLRRSRVYSYDEKFKTKEALAKELKISIWKLDEVEKGNSELDLRIASRWCALTGHYEKWEAIRYIYRLDPFATPPIHPELNQVATSGVLNFQEEHPEAGDAAMYLARCLNKRVPSRPVDAREMLEPAKQVFDVMKAAWTLLVALERECGLSIEEVGRVWTQDALAKGILMPPVDVEKELAMAR